VSGHVFSECVRNRVISESEERREVKRIVGKVEEAVSLKGKWRCEGRIWKRGVFGR